jgi:hypothetical protein
MERRRIVNVDSEVEKKTLIALIMSDEVCNQLIPKARPEFFNIGYAGTVFSWIATYHQKYRLAPKKAIQDLYQAERENLSPELSSLISQFLSGLSSEYENMDDLPTKFIVDQATKLFRGRSLDVMVQQVKGLSDLGKLNEAEKLLRDHQTITKNLSDWVDPFSPEAMEFLNTQDEDAEFFRFPGAVGELLGNWEPGELVGFMAPFKRGKSWWLLEASIWGILSQRKVVYVNLEMDHNKFMTRIYSRITGAGDYEGDYIVPCFDCRKNQFGTCNRRERRNRETLIISGNEKPKFSQTSGVNYKPCTYCREKDPGSYEMASWYTVIKGDRLTLPLLRKKMKAIRTFIGSRFRVITYPAFGASLQDVVADLDTLYYSDGFMPDVIVIDYADILAPEDRRMSGRDVIDMTWKTLKNIAASRHSLVITATQANKMSSEKRSLEAIDVAEDYRKLAHVDRMIMLSQTPIEKDEGIMRIGAIQRHTQFNPFDQVQVLMSLSLGQPLLDSIRSPLSRISSSH